MNQREIKFRSWVKEISDGEITLPGYMDYDPIWQDIKAVRVEQKDVAESVMVEVVKSHIAKVNDLFKPEHKLMQYTGLKDKNGKEIYQDDILNIDGLNVKVEWYNGAWTVEYFTSPKRSYLSTFDETDVEVVGNVYEHPHLLNSSEGP